MEKITIKKEIKPYVFILNSKVYNITRINPEYLISEYTIFLNDNKTVEKVVLKDGEKHPNCNPRNNELCISDEFKHRLFDKSITQFEIESMLLIWNNDNRYFMDWNSFDYSDEPIGGFVIREVL